MLQKTIESSLDCKEIQPVHLKADQSWVFMKDWCWSWNSKTLATWCEELTHWKRPRCWERLKAGEGDNRGWDGWMTSPTQWTWVWVSSGSWLDREAWHAVAHGVVESWTRLSDWTELNWIFYVLNRGPRQQQQGVVESWFHFSMNVLYHTDHIPLGSTAREFWT